MTDIIRSDAATLAAKIAIKEVSSAEITRACLDQIEATDETYHAFLHVAADEALAAAAAIDKQVAAGEPLPSALAGVPLALKDVFTTSDMPTTCGSKILEGWRSPYDATLTARLRAAGIPILGKTNMDEFAMGSSTENSAYGPTRNPWNLDRVPSWPAAARPPARCRRRPTMSSPETRRDPNTTRRWSWGCRFWTRMGSGDCWPTDPRHERNGTANLRAVFRSGVTLGEPWLPTNRSAQHRRHDAG